MSFILLNFKLSLGQVTCNLFVLPVNKAKQHKKRNSPLFVTFYNYVTIKEPNKNILKRKLCPHSLSLMCLTLCNTIQDSQWVEIISEVAIIISSIICGIIIQGNCIVIKQQECYFKNNFTPLYLQLLSNPPHASHQRSWSDRRVEQKIKIFFLNYLEK